MVTLSFTPSMLKEGILIMKIEEEEDICLQIKECETTLICYIIGDNLYELEMLKYVKKVWGLLNCLRYYIMIMDTMFLNFVI
ncbi:hypothetical protein RDI58_022169 [Solanum bulbocastanum]|uniref:Uncharacterized protein n=1 Tax=Solanum bulbocastanum TaxID=147425 RepID=A0AAN8T3L2_SOLBU